MFKFSELVHIRIEGIEYGGDIAEFVMSNIARENGRKEWE